MNLQKQCFCLVSVSKSTNHAVYAVEQLLRYNSRTQQYDLSCTEEWIRTKSNTDTVRIKKKKKNGKNEYIRVSVLKIASTRKELSLHLHTGGDNLGRGQRVRQPKKINHTPDVVGSAKKAVKTCCAVSEEKADAMIAKKKSKEEKRIIAQRAAMRIHSLSEILDNQTSDDHSPGGMKSFTNEVNNSEGAHDVIEEVSTQEIPDFDDVGENESIISSGSESETHNENMSYNDGGSEGESSIGDSADEKNSSENSESSEGLNEKSLRTVIQPMLSVDCDKLCTPSSSIIENSQEKNPLMSSQFSEYGSNGMSADDDKEFISSTEDTDLSTSTVPVPIVDGNNDSVQDIESPLEENLIGSPATRSEISIRSQLGTDIEPILSLDGHELFTQSSSLIEDTELEVFRKNPQFPKLQICRGSIDDDKVSRTEENPTNTMDIQNNDLSASNISEPIVDVNDSVQNFESPLPEDIAESQATRRGNSIHSQNVKVNKKPKIIEIRVFQPGQSISLGEPPSPAENNILIPVDSCTPLTHIKSKKKMTKQESRSQSNNLVRTLLPPSPTKLNPKTSVTLEGLGNYEFGSKGSNDFSSANHTILDSDQRPVVVTDVTIVQQSRCREKTFSENTVQKNSHDANVYKDESDTVAIRHDESGSGKKIVESKKQLAEAKENNSEKQAKLSDKRGRCAEKRKPESWDENEILDSERPLTAKDLRPELDRIKEDIIRQIKKTNRTACNHDQNTDKENIRGVDRFILPRPEADGKVTLSNGDRFDSEYFTLAADAATMRKRVNHLISAFWTLEERLLLTLQNDPGHHYKLISRAQIKSLQLAALLLQDVQKLNQRGAMNPEKNLRRWISAKIKTDRRRYSVKGKKKCNTDDSSGTEKDTIKHAKKRLQGKKKTSPSSQTVNIKNGAKLSKTCPSGGDGDGSSRGSGGAHRDGIVEAGHRPSIMDAMHHLKSLGNGKAYKNIGVAQTINTGEELLKMLQSSIYRGPESEKSISPETLHSCDKIRSMIKVSTAEESGIIFANCCAIINGKCRLIEYDYEVMALMECCKTAFGLFCNYDEFNKDAIIRYLSNEYLPEIINYIFEKYTVPNEKVSANGAQLYSLCREKYIQTKIFHLLRSRNSWDYDEILDAIRYTPYYDKRVKLPLILMTMATYSSKNNSNGKYEVVRIDGLSEFDPKRIIIENWQILCAAQRNNH